MNDSTSDFLRLLMLDHKSRKEYLPKAMTRVRVDYGELYFETNSPLHLAFAWARETLPRKRDFTESQASNLAALYAVLHTTLEYFSDTAFNELADCDEDSIWGYCGLWIVLRHYAGALLAPTGDSPNCPSKTFNENYIQSGYGSVV
jgi:hypothetical protein